MSTKDSELANLSRPILLMLHDDYRRCGLAEQAAMIRRELTRREQGKVGKS